MEEDTFEPVPKTAQAWSLQERDPGAGSNRAPELIGRIIYGNQFADRLVPVLWDRRLVATHSGRRTTPSLEVAGPAAMACLSPPARRGKEDLEIKPVGCARLGPRWVRFATVSHGHQRSPTVTNGPEEPQVAALVTRAAGTMRVGDSDCGPEGRGFESPRSP